MDFIYWCISYFECAIVAALMFIGIWIIYMLLLHGPNDCKNFVEYIKTDEAKKIITQRDIYNCFADSAFSKIIVKILNICLWPIYYFMVLFTLTKLENVYFKN